jgi:protein TonB
MLAYAASRPTPIVRRPHPNARHTSIALLVGVAAGVFSAKKDLPGRQHPEPPIRVTLYPEPKTPPPDPRPAHPSQQLVENRTVDQPPIHVETPVRLGETVDPPPTHFDDGALAGGGAVVIPEIPKTIHNMVKLGPRLVTSAAELKPPYPPSKLLVEEEASLRLRLTIDEQGRVTAVEPIGRADPVFLAAARRHLIAHWRYRPATEDGHAVSTTEVITLHFQLDG